MEPTQQNTTAMQLAMNISRRLDALQSKHANLRAQITATQTYQTHLRDLLHTMQKQMLYLLHNPVFPLLSGETHFSVWHMTTHKFIDCNEEFLSLTKYRRETLLQDFLFPDLFPIFFQPFAFDFYNEMQHNITQKRDTKVTQMVYVLTADREEIPLHMSCHAQFDQTNLPTTFAMYLWRIA